MPFHCIAEASGDLIEQLLRPERITLVGVLMLIVWAFIKGWIVPRQMYLAEKDRADRMEKRAFEATDALGRAIDNTKETAQAVRQAVLHHRRQ